MQSQSRVTQLQLQHFPTHVTVQLAATAHCAQDRALETPLAGLQDACRVSFQHSMAKPDD
jgi:hypothetical protein